MKEGEFLDWLSYYLIFRPCLGKCVRMWIVLIWVMKGSSGDSFLWSLCSITRRSFYNNWMNTLPRGDIALWTCRTLLLVLYSPVVNKQLKCSVRQKFVLVYRISHTLRSRQKSNNPWLCMEASPYLGTRGMKWPVWCALPRKQTQVSIG
jgi:hypothetical protein